MIYTVLCDYCGNTVQVTEKEMEQHISLRCPICQSKRTVKQHKGIDGYKGCPPFPKKNVTKPVTKEEEEYEHTTYADLLTPIEYGHMYD